MQDKQVQDAKIIATFPFHISVIVAFPSVTTYIY